MRSYGVHPRTHVRGVLWYGVKGDHVTTYNVVPKDGAALEPSHHHVVQYPRSIEARLPRHLNQLP